MVVKLFPKNSGTISGRFWLTSLTDRILRVRINFFRIAIKKSTATTLIHKFICVRIEFHRIDM